MASTSDRKRWEEQASFMREANAVHAEWTASGELTRLVLAPLTPPRPPAPTQPTPKPDGPAARLAKMHETMFAASSMRPPHPSLAANPIHSDRIARGRAMVAAAEAEDTRVVPRASAKKAATRGSSTKNQKRGS